MADVWNPALAGNELYLNGLYSGITSSHLAFSKYGMNPRRLIHHANRAAGVTPIIGDISTRLVGRGSCGRSSASRAYFTASAPPFE